MQANVGTERKAQAEISVFSEGPNAGSRRLLRKKRVIEGTALRPSDHLITSGCQMISRLTCNLVLDKLTSLT